MEIVLIVVVILVALAVYEYRFRKPDQIVVYETRDGVGMRKGRLYARHLSMPITRTSHSFAQTIDASAKGNLDIRVKLAVTVSASPLNLGTLLRVGGWSADVVARAARELEVVLHGYVKAFTELHEIGDLSSENIREYLQRRIAEIPKSLGLDVVALTIASFEPVNPQIAEALKQREHARILEEAESLNQQARIAAARARLKAEEEIAIMESELEVKKADLKKTELEKEAALSRSRAEHDLQLKKMQLDHEREELKLLKESPELLLLTPQAARLAEASQSLKNARTVVSLSPNDAAQGTELLGMFHSLLQNALESYRKKKDK